MLQTYSHTFTFQTKDNINKNCNSCENIISITEEDSKKHYIQYMQYRIDNENNIMAYKEINIKVDRSYYLEIANISIDNITRKAKFFTMLGKRRFGFSSKHINSYFINKEKESLSVLNTFKNLKENDKHLPILFEQAFNNLNRYEASVFKCDDGFFVHMVQTNISNRKTIEKIFLLELNEKDFLQLQHISNNQHKIDFIFTKIGEIYFRLLNEESTILNNLEKDVKSTVNEVFNKDTYELELSAKINANKVYHLLKDKGEQIEKTYFNLYSKSMDLSIKSDNKQTITLFSSAIISFVSQFKEINELDNITSYLTVIHLLAEDGKLHYLFKKHDPDLRDIFIYVIECLTDWNSHLNSSDESIRNFNIATIDLQNALKHLIDTYFKFNHEYQCQDAIQDILLVNNYNKETTLEITSAADYLAEVEIDNEVYEEFLELENDINDLPYLLELDEDILQHTIHFFEGYSHALNTLFEFKDLGYSLSLLATQLKNADIYNGNEKAILTILKAIIADLLEWHKLVFIEKNAQDIHYMDKSFYSNISQFERLLSNVDDSEENLKEELELF